MRARSMDNESYETQPKKKKAPAKTPIEQYEHSDKKRPNNPHVGLITPQNDSDSAGKEYKFDPHLDPTLDWAGKEERDGFNVPTVSLHVHEQIDPRSIIETVRKTNTVNYEQMSLFNKKEMRRPVQEEIEFYKHSKNWSNRLIAGDSLLVMNSLLEKEGFTDKVQMVYMDPPYGIKYGSNFQPFVNKRDVKDGRDEDLNQEPEMLKAFRDTWEMGVHSYLSYIRERLLLTRQLLNESGSCFVQIGEENVHYIRAVMSEIFGAKNFVSLIYFKTTGGFGSGKLSRIGDYLVWFAKDIEKLKYNQLFFEKAVFEGADESYKFIELADGVRQSMTKEQKIGREPIPNNSEVFRLGDICGQGAPKEPTPFEFMGRTFNPSKNNHWKPAFPKGLERLALSGRIKPTGNTLNYVRYLNDKAVTEINNAWMDTGTAGFTSDKKYVVETNPKIVERCLLMTTDPGDLALDITCGSGTTAFAAEKWGRRWVAVDTSRIAVTLTKQRLMTSVFDYYKVKNEAEGVSSGFLYNSVPYIKMSTISNNEEIDEIFSRYEKPLNEKLAILNKAMKSKMKILDVPDEASEEWSASAKEAWNSFNSVRRTMRIEIRESTKRRADKINLVHSPIGDDNKVRVTGPFTVEAVPAPIVKPLTLSQYPHANFADNSVSKTGETGRQKEWRDEIFRTGIRSNKGNVMKFVRVEPLAGTKFLHAEAETDEKSGKTVLISFGPDHAPLEQKQVSLAIEEALMLKKKPDLIVFAAFQFDAEAAKDIDECEIGGIQCLKAQMNADLLTADLKKKRASNESFWMVGQPDIDVRKVKTGDNKGLTEVEVFGFDYYNPTTGTLDTGTTSNIAMWMLDTDYDGRSVFPRQVFFPMAGKNDGWAKLAKSLHSEIDLELIEQYQGSVSIPFSPGKHGKIAVKIIDDRGIESIRIMDIK